jgi:hypothetical protein
MSNGVTSIGSYAFEECYALEGIFIPITVTEMGCDIFGSGDFSVSIYCEAESEPDSWDSDWDFNYVGSHSVEWGHTHSHTDGKCVCGKIEN